MPDALIPVLRSAVLLALATYWWAADFAEKSGSVVPRHITRMVIAYIVLVQLFTRLFDALWSVYINGPAFYWLVAKGYTPTVVQAYISPVNALVQVTMMVGFSFWAFRLARAYRERGLQRSQATAPETAPTAVSASVEAAPLERVSVEPVSLEPAPPGSVSVEPASLEAVPFEAAPLETTPVTAAPRRAAASAAARRAAALFTLSFLLLHILGGEFALRMIGFLLIVGMHTGASTLPITTAIVALLAYAAARRNLPATLTRVGAASAGLAAFRTYLWLHLAAVLLFAIYGAALILADRGIDAILPMLLGMGMLYLLAIYPACRRFVRRYYHPAIAA